MCGHIDIWRLQNETQGWELEVKLGGSGQISKIPKLRNATMKITNMYIRHRIYNSMTATRHIHDRKGNVNEDY